MALHQRTPSGGQGPSERAASEQHSSKALELVEIIAKGTNCNLWWGCIRGSNQTVTVKTLKQKVPPKPLMDEFAEEAAMLQRITHPNVMRFFGARLRPPRPCIVMEATTVGSLRRVLENPKLHTLTWAEKLSLAADAAAGLQALHDHDIVHGDVKSFTIVVCKKDNSYRAKITEFGHNKFRVPLEVTDQTDRLHRSLAWQAPERLQATSPPKPTTDVYSLGMVLYELATGKMPFSDSDAYTTRQRISQGKRPALPAGLPEAFNQLYKACCAVNPADRPAMLQVFQALKKLMQQEPPEVKEATSPTQQKAAPVVPLLRVSSPGALRGPAGPPADPPALPTVTPVEQQAATAARASKMRSDSAASSDQSMALGTQQAPTAAATVAATVPAVALASSSTATAEEATLTPLQAARRSVVTEMDAEGHTGQSEGSSTTSDTTLKAADSPTATAQTYDGPNAPQAEADTPKAHADTPQANTPQARVRVHSDEDNLTCAEGNMSPVLHLTANASIPGTPATPGPFRMPSSALADADTVLGLDSPHVPDTPHEVMVHVPQSPASTARSLSANMGPAALVKIIGSKNKRCDDKVEASMALVDMIRSQPAARQQFLRAGAVQQLLRLMRCCHTPCQRAALRAIVTLCDAPDDDGATAMRKQGLRGLLAWKAMCTSPNSSHKCANNAVMQLVESDGVRIVSKVLETPRGQQPPAPLEEALKCLYKVSQYATFASEMTKYKVLRTIVNVLHRQDTEECDHLAIVILTQLSEVAPTMMDSGARLGMVAALVNRLESPSPQVASVAAHLLAQIAITDDARVAIAKEGPVDVPVLLLENPQTALPAAELLGSLAGCDYIKQVLGTRGAISGLTHQLAIAPSVVPEALRALVVMCDLPQHQRLLIEAGGVSPLLRLAAGTLPPTPTSVANRTLPGTPSSNGSKQTSNSRPSSQRESNRTSTSDANSGSELDTGRMQHDKWPMVKYRAACLLDMLADTPVDADGGHVLGRHSGISWMGRALTTLLNEVAQGNAVTQQDKTAAALHNKAIVHLATAFHKLATACRACHADIISGKALSALMGLVQQQKAPQEARAEAADALASLADCAESAEAIGQVQLLRGLRHLVSKTSTMPARRAACRAVAALAVQPTLRPLLVQEGLHTLIVPLLQDEQAVHPCLSALLSISHTSDLLLHVVDSGALPRVLPLADTKGHSSRATALQLVLEICKTSEGRQLVVDLEGVKVLARVLHAEDSVQELCDPAAGALSSLASDSGCTAAVNRENVVGFLVEAVSREEWPFKPVTMQALALLAQQDATSQYAVATSGIVPVLAPYLKEKQSSALRAATADVITALAKDSQPNQEMLAGRNTLPLLVNMLTLPEQDESNENPTAAEEGYMMLEAAIAAVATITADNAAVQDAAREAGAVQPLVKLLTATASPAVRSYAALAMANLTFDDGVKQLLAAQLHKK